MALVIPSYVPLHRLPAASGLQLISAGIFYFFAGPLVGMLFFFLITFFLKAKNLVHSKSKQNRWNLIKKEMKRASLSFCTFDQATFVIRRIMR